MPTAVQWRKPLHEMAFRISNLSLGAVLPLLSSGWSWKYVADNSTFDIGVVPFMSIPAIKPFSCLKLVTENKSKCLS